MTIWFTSDTHFFHTNIIEYCNRPFKSVYHMNEEIVRRWNSVVKEDDLVYHLGDIAVWFGEGIKEKVEDLIESLNGKKIFIKGNHDHKSNILIPTLNADIQIKGWVIHISHEPNPIYKMNFSGHVHEKYDILRIGNKTVVNVGVDVWDFYPTNIEKINERLDEKGMRKIE